MKHIKIKNLSKNIRGELVLNNINLELQNSMIYGFYGRNGSGKTMLFRAISGLIKPTEGTISFDNKILFKDIEIPHNLGIIIENPGFWDDYTGFENLKMLASIRNKITDTDIKTTMQKLNLNPDEKKNYKKYSLGMKQKLAICQAIMENPEILILDEPTNALDSETVNIVRQILLSEKAKGTLILIASHNKDDIDLLADKKYELIDGKLSTQKELL
ncbi:MAG: ABC transporter ATP-binding protein [Clostridium sp.]